MGADGASEDDFGRVEVLVDRLADEVRLGRVAVPCAMTSASSACISADMAMLRRMPLRDIPFLRCHQHP